MSQPRRNQFRPLHRPAQAQHRLTPRQLEIVTLLRDYQQQHGYSPTMQELADSMGLSKVTVFEHVGGLISKGWLRRLPNKARSLELTARAAPPDYGPRTLPVLGYIAAGQPLETPAQQETLELDSYFASRHETFVLKVRGNSMIDAHIQDGDYVVCEKRSEPRSGETVVALLENGETTLKKYYRDGNRVRLQPANPEHEPILVDEVIIQGVVLGLVRRC